jgi:hypothetical protein
MRNLTKLLLFSTLLFLSCAENELIPETENPVSNEPPIRNEPKDFPVTETAEPFVLIHDKGFEAMLIFRSIDSDNQINGKVSVEDLERVTSISSENIGRFYMEKKLFIEKMYKEFPKIISFDDIKNVRNLKVLETYGGEHLDLSHNLDLEEIRLVMPGIKTINLKNLNKLKKIDFSPAPGTGWYPPEYIDNIHNFKEIDVSDNVALEVFKYYASAPTFDLSKNVNLRELHLTSRGYMDTVLDLSNNKLLEVLDCSDLSSLKEVLVSKEVMAKINPSNGKWKKPEAAIWKIKN